MQHIITDKVLKPYQNLKDSINLKNIIKNQNRYEFEIFYNNAKYIDINCDFSRVYFDLDFYACQEDIVISFKSSKNVFLVCHICDKDKNEIASRRIPPLCNYVINIDNNMKFCFFSLRFMNEEKSYIDFISFDFFDFKSTHIKKIDDECTLRFVVKNIKQKDKGIIIFFPAAFNRKNSFPEYTRWSWMDELNDYCTICVANPFTKHPWFEPCNTWFINKNAESVLNVLSDEILNIIGECKSKVLTYGSSMGGYAAIISAYYLNANFCIAECPQTNLKTYKQSNNFLLKLHTQPQEEFLDIFSFLSNKKINYKIKFIFNNGDFYHINSFFEHFNKDNDDVIKNLPLIEINIFREHNNNIYNYGHVALTKNTAIKMIRHTMETLKI